jgi:hypothetical protein
MKQNNELIHFLNSGVKVRDNEDNNIYSLYGVSLAGGSELLLLDKNSRVIESSFYSATPYLYPLSVLTKTINHESKDEIPLVELAKIEGTYKGEEYKVKINTIFMCIVFNSIFDNNRVIFGYDIQHKSFYKKIDLEPYHLCNQLLLFQYLFSRRINVFGIEAIDPRTLDVNPYKI